MSYTSSTINGEQAKRGSTFDLAVQGKGEDSDLRIHVLSVIDIPPVQLPTIDDLQKWDHLQSIPWCSFENLELGLLIGADAPDAFWVVDERRGGPGEPYAIKTPLGWTVMGPGGSSGSFSTHCHRITCCDNSMILDHLKRSWSVEEDTRGEGDSVQDVRAKCIMDSSVSLSNDGHYQLGLLWKADNTILPFNKPLAELRLQSLKRKLEKDEDMLQRYSETMEGYIEKGYAEQVIHEGEPGRVWYLPHHPVVNPHKSKIRVVFDCAAKWKDSSLNACLLKGPDTVNNLVGVLLRFRQQQVVVVADIEAMFHQVRVIPEDRDMLRFLWWPDGKLDATPKEYRMTVHLFGATSSPACAGYALRRSAADNEEYNQDSIGKSAIDAIKDNFYVDDLLSSSDTPAMAISLAKRIKYILSNGGFKLTKWLSNDRTVLDSIPESERTPKITSLDKLPTEKTLGVIWNAENDTFRFEISLRDKSCTRRGLLSVASQIFDPLGFAAPFVIIARSLLQSVCKKGVDWDETLTYDVLMMWKAWLKQVPSLSSVEIPRWLRLEKAKSVELHIFCDASKKGYAAVAYARVVEHDDVIRCVFVMGKARVSPIKIVTIPRLELMAAVLATSLDIAVREEVRFPISESTFWTDSTIVLGYIRNEDRRFKTFVANRVSKIRDVSSPHQWRHVSTKNNPADDGSRGTADLTRWLSGPDFLLETSEKWPVSKYETLDMSQDPEVSRSVTHMHVVTDTSVNFPDALVSSSSSWMKLVRVVAWVRRFTDKCRGIKSVVDGGLSVTELEASMTFIISWSQRREFGSWRQDQRLVKLKPVLMGGVLRVGGRLDNSDLNREKKHPIILPPKGHLTTLIVRHYHASVGHSGLAMTLGAIRQRFWLLNGRAGVKSALSKCVVCRKILARPAQQEMATLPRERVLADRPPFTFVGVDYFGPLEIKQGRSRVKRYGCIFTCLVSRAVHLEVSASLDTNSFLNAYRRFVARRGQPEKMFSDNGTNFHAGAKELRQAVKSMNSCQIEAFMHNKGCEWHFNPPSASHFGGAWERLIRSVRRNLQGVLGQQTVCEEVLVTVLTEVESILNSRPLTDLSQDPRDEETLTPNHLLLLKEGPDAPATCIDESIMYGRKRWLQVQYLAALFWTRWRKEYLPLLQQRKKWTTPKENVRVEDIVLLVDETTPRGKWRVGRVLSVYKSGDGRVRSVDLKVGNNVLKRPIVKICIIHRPESSDANL